MPKKLNINLDELKEMLENEKQRLLSIPNNARNWTEYLRLYKNIKYREDIEYREKEQIRANNYNKNIKNTSLNIQVH